MSEEEQKLKELSDFFKRMSNIIKLVKLMTQAKNEYDKYGLLVMDTRCSDASESPQYIVYGHNARTGSMFGELKDYRTQRYYEMHPTITFDTLYETAIICNGGKNVQLQTADGDKIVINLEQYIQDEIMNYCYNN